ncbi:MAG: glucosyl-3-phosphoglycerate synthase [Actinomycetota bacterium]
MPSVSGGQTVSVCLPALDEEATIGAICSSIRTSLMPRVVDELIVIDSGSSDATAVVAEESGARVHHVDDIAPRLQAGGKGEALWKSLAVARGDIVVWIDSDIRNFTPAFVTKLVGPLVRSPELVMTKAFYRRPLLLEDHEGSGGRVTELGVRPLLNLLYPELAHIVQPLSGEYALRRDAALDLNFFSGYGVDIGLLIDAVRRFGTSALRQVDLGTRVHNHRSLHDLGRTSFEVQKALLTRMADVGRVALDREMADRLVQFDADHAPRVTYDEMVELPSRNAVAHALTIDTHLTRKGRDDVEAA